MNEKDKVINIVNLTFYVLRNWLKIGLFAIVGAILFLGIFFILRFSNMQKMQAIVPSGSTDTPEVQAQQAKLDVQMSAAHFYEDCVNNYKNTNNVTQEYVNNSVLMAIDPLNKPVVKKTYHIDLDIQDANSLTSADPIDEIIALYAADFALGIDFSALSERFNKEERYLRELVSVEQDYNANSLSIICTGINSEMALKICEVAENELLSRQRLLGDYLPSHIIEKVYDSAQFEVDTGLFKTQNSNRDSAVSIRTSLIKNENALADTQIEIESIQSEIKKLEKGIQNGFQENQTGKLTSKSRFVFIGIILGIIVSLFVIILDYILNDKLRRDGDITYYWAIPVLGVLDRKPSFGVCQWIDRMLFRIEGVNRGISDDFIMDTINATIINRIKPGESMVIAGCGNKETFNYYCESIISKLDNINIEKIFGLSNDSNTMGILRSAKYLLLIEERDCSSIKTIDMEISMAHNVGMHILGCLVC